MVSHSADQFDPRAGAETTLEMVSGLPRRIARARVQAAAMLASEALDRARNAPSDRSALPRGRKPKPDLGRNVATPQGSADRFAYGAELMIISFCFLAIVAGMVLNLFR
jgi:hypothetical protein